MFISVSLHWVLVPILFFMLKVSNAGLETAWKVVVGLFLLFSGFVYLRYRSGKWRTITMLKQPPLVPVAQVVADDFHEISDL